jgi:hypothetical protein
LTKRNNYGTVNVLVSSNSTPLSGINVLLRDSAGAVTIGAGLTSDGTTSGGTNGHIVFPYVRAGNYKVTADYPYADSPTTQTQNTSLTAGATQPVSIAFVTTAGWKTAVSENFEGDVAASMSDGDGYLYGEYYWGKTAYRKNAGSYGAWAVRDGYHGRALPDTAYYPSYANSWMVFGPFSTVGATDISCQSYQWLNTEINFDYLWFFASTDGYNFSGHGSSGGTAAWASYTVPFTGTEKTALLGKNQVWFAILFESDLSVQYPGGAYVDDVLVRVNRTY